jgi:hypothetical protein
MSSAERVRKHREQRRVAGRDRWEVRGDRADRELVRRLTAEMANRRELRGSVERLLEQSATGRKPIKTWAEFRGAFLEALGPDAPEFEWPERDRTPDREFKIDWD